MTDQFTIDEAGLAKAVSEIIKGVVDDLPSGDIARAAITAYLAAAPKAQIAEGWVLAPRKLLEEAHAVMRACGWQLAPGAETQSDGVLEAAAAEIEERFSELLAPPTTGEQK